MADGQKTPLCEGSTIPDGNSAAPHAGGVSDEPGGVELSLELRADLLDPAAWAPVLETYARTMKVAVAFIDRNGKVLGRCHNPQPVWLFVQDAATTAAQPRPDHCCFCLTQGSCCTSISDAFRTGGVSMALSSPPD